MAASTRTGSCLNTHTQRPTQQATPPDTGLDTPGQLECECRLRLEKAVWARLENKTHTTAPPTIVNLPKSAWIKSKRHKTNMEDGSPARTAPHRSPRHANRRAQARAAPSTVEPTLPVLLDIEAARR